MFIHSYPRVQPSSKDADQEIPRASDKKQGPMPKPCSPLPPNPKAVRSALQLRTCHALGPYTQVMTSSFLFAGSNFSSEILWEPAFKGSKLSEIFRCFMSLPPAVSTGEEQKNAHSQTHQFMDYPEVGYSKTKADVAISLLTMFRERNCSLKLLLLYKM